MPYFDYRAKPYQAKDTSDTNIVSLPIRYVPLMVWAVEMQKDHNDWVTTEDWSAGYTHICAVQWELLMGNSMADLLESNNRLYRLLDTSLNGTQYTSSPNPADPARPLVEPAIPAVPPASTSAPNALRAHVGRLHLLAENAATGAEYPAGSGVEGSAALDYDGSWRARLERVQGLINEGWFGIGGEPATVAHIVEALRIGTPQDAARIDTALEALSAASSSSVIFGTVRDLLGDVVETGLEGATLGTLIAASIASSAQLGILAGQIDRLVAALDGGGLVPATPAPAGSVLGELDAIKVQLQ